MTRADQKTVLALIETEIDRAERAAHGYLQIPQGGKASMREVARAERLQMLAARQRKAWGMKST